LIGAADFNQYVAQALAISMVTVLNFTGNKLWSFRQPTAR
jgi:putative flippase GtrA